MAVDLEREIQSKAGKLAYFFAKPLGLSPDEYMDRIVRPTDQPEDFAGLVDIPVIVQLPVPGLSLRRILAAAGIKADFPLNTLRDGSRTDKVEPHVVWLDNGLRSKGKSLPDVRESLSGAERCARVVEVACLILNAQEEELSPDVWSLAFPEGIVFGSYFARFVFPTKTEVFKTRPSGEPPVLKIGNSGYSSHQGVVIAGK